MKVFDFDNTIYLGESSVDFFLLMVKKNKNLVFYLPKVFYALLRYKLCLVSKEKLENIINKYLKVIIKDKKIILDLVDEFWKNNYTKLDNKMLELIDKDDVIITAGPNFLINGIRDRLNTKNIISTEVDLDKCEIINFNFGFNKVISYKNKYGDKKIDEFYTDSYNDKPLMELAEKSYLVKKGKIE